MKENEPIMTMTYSDTGNPITLGEQVTSLEEGYAELLLENRKLGEEIQRVTKARHEADDQIAINRTACQNLIDEKNERIKALEHALADAKACNDRLDHRLELMGRKTATSMRIEEWDKQDLSTRADMNTAGKATPVPPTFGDVQLAKSIYHNPYYMAIRKLLTFEGNRILDVLLKLDGVSD